VSFDPSRVGSTTRDPMRLRAELQARLDAIDEANTALTTLRDVFIKHPDLVTYFTPGIRTLLDFIDEEVDEPSSTLDSDDGSTALSRIIRFFEDRGNRPAVMSEIVDGVGGNSVTIRQVLYKRHRDKFAFEEVQAGKRLWQLSAEMWAAKFSVPNRYSAAAADDTEDIPF